MSRLALSIVLAALALTGQAAAIGQEQARQVAQQFLSTLARTHAHDNTLTAVTPTAMRAPAATQQASPCYIFNARDAFVIVAGDDSGAPVLGYGDNATLDPGNLPAPLLQLLEQHAHSAAPQHIGTRAVTPVYPLLKSNWGQHAPYNLQCPVIDSDSTRAPTGSVATALAQVLNYHKYPSRPTRDIPSYYCEQLHLDIPLVLRDTFPLWSSVKDYYKADVTDMTATAVSQVLQFCAQAIETDYGTQSKASAQRIIEVLPDLFNYAKTIKYLRRKYYTSSEWNDLIVDELNNRRPVIYRSASFAGESHSFVIDGIDSEGRFHVNWGCDGSGNGYFLLNELKADDSHDLLDTDAAMITGIMPYTSSYGVRNDGTLAFYDLSVKQQRYTRSTASAPFDGVSVTGRFSNCGAYSTAYDMGFELVGNLGQVQQYILVGTADPISPNRGVTHDWNIPIDATLPAGSYELRPVSRLKDVGKWMPCTGGEANYAIATISGNTLTLTPMGNSGEVSLTVDSATTHGPAQVGREEEVRATLTNTGTATMANVYLLVNGKCEDATLCHATPGTSGDIALQWVPQATGLHTVSIATDREGTSTLWRGTATIIEPQPATLTCTAPKMVGIVLGKVINSGTFEMTTTVTNAGTRTYCDKVVAHLYRMLNDSVSGLHGVKAQEVDLARGGTGEARFAFGNLQEREMFYATISYYDNGALVQMAVTPTYTMLGDLRRGDVNGDHNVDIGDLNIVLNIILGLDTSHYGGRDDVNGDGVVDISDINIIINIILGILT